MDKTTSTRTLSVRCQPADSEKLSSCLAAYTRENNVPDETADELRLVCEEIFINISSYAFSDEGEHPISIEMSCTGTTISVAFTDDGIAFDPLTDCTADIEDNDPCQGGMGIHLIKSLTNTQRYQRIEQRNIFTVTKHYNDDSQ